MLNVLYEHHFQEKYIFVVYSQVYKSRPLKKFTIHNFNFSLIPNWSMNINSIDFQLQVVDFVFVSLGLVVAVCPGGIVTTMLWGWSSIIFIFLKDDHNARGKKNNKKIGGVSSRLLCQLVLVVYQQLLNTLPAIQTQEKKKKKKKKFYCM